MSQDAVRRSFASLGLGEVAARLVAFAATVYLARVLGAGVYGVVALAGAVLLYFTYLGDLGIESVGVAAIARAPQSTPSVVPAVLAARMAAGGILALVLGAAGFLLPQPEGAILALYGLTLPVRGMLARWAVIGLGRPGLASVARVAGEAASAVLVVALVRGAGDLGVVPLTQLAGDAVAALVLLAALRPAVSAVALRSAWGAALPVLREAWPVVLNTLLALLVFNADLIILRFFRDSATVGQYAAAYTLVSFLANLGITYGFAVMPQAARSAADPGPLGELVRGALVFALALTLPVAAGGLFTTDGLVALVFGRGYADAGLPMRILLWSVPLAWLRSVTQLTLVAMGRQRAVLGVTAVVAVVTVVLDLALIPRWGMVAAAGVTVAVEGIRLVAMLAVAARAGVAPPRLLAWWRPVAASAVMAAVLAAWRGPTLPMVAAGAVAYAAALGLTGAVRRGADGRLAIRL